MIKFNILTISFFFLVMTSTFSQLEGSWQGTAKVENTTIDLIFHVKKNGDQWSATMDIPQQQVQAIPVNKIVWEQPKIQLYIDAANMLYMGELQNTVINGTLKQAEMEMPLALKKTKIKLPGDPSLPSSEQEITKLISQDTGKYKYSVESYFQKPFSSNFKLSPNGKYMSYMEKDGNNKRHLVVVDISNGESHRAAEEKDEPIKGYAWANNERVLYVMDEGGNEDYHIFAADINGENVKNLTPFKGVQASIINMLKDQKESIIISMNKDNPQVFEPYKVNIQSGKIEKLYNNDDYENPIVDYDFDKDGNLRGFSKMVGGIYTHYYYKTEKEFVRIKECKWYEQFSVLGFTYNQSNPHEAYVLTNLESDKSQIVLYDFRKNSIIKEVFSHPEYDVKRLALSRKRNYEIDYINYEGEKNEIIPVSHTFKRVFERLQQEFGKYEIIFVDKTDDEDKLLFAIQSDRMYGKYYTYDVAKDDIALVHDLMPTLNEGDMATMIPISFAARDGKIIHGYITLPSEAASGEKKVPLIVNPHGGPQGVRDSWGFNPEVQLFASRGYATLQVNFRISGGYGKEYLQAGFKQIGRAVMDDIEDGVAFAIEQGWIDKDRIAIYGGSHGGYATLMGLVKTPELYKCGVDYVGVSNIETFFASFPEYWKPYTEMVKEIWYDLDNPEEAEIARKVSPVYQINKIKSPLFVVQGANDPRVKIEESDQIVAALRANGFDVPYLVKYNEGHGFYHEENVIQFYKAMMGFFAMHL